MGVLTTVYPTPNVGKPAATDLMLVLQRMTRHVELVERENRMLMNLLALRISTGPASVLTADGSPANDNRAPQSH